MSDSVREEDSRDRPLEAAAGGAGAETSPPADDSGDGMAGDGDAGVVGDDARRALDGDAAGSAGEADDLSPLLQEEIDREVAAAFGDASEGAADGTADSNQALTADDVAAAAAAVDEESLQADREAEQVMMDEMSRLEAELEGRQAEEESGEDVAAGGDGDAAFEMMEEMKATGGELPPQQVENTGADEVSNDGAAEIVAGDEGGTESDLASAEAVLASDDIAATGMSAIGDDLEDGPTAEEQALLDAELADLPTSSQAEAKPDEADGAAEEEESGAVEPQTFKDSAGDEGTSEVDTGGKQGESAGRNRDKKDTAGAGGAGDSDGAGKDAPPPARTVGALAGDLSLGCLKLLAGGLELVDRPFRGVGPDTRDLIGKVAIATFLAALLIAAISLVLF